MRSVIKPPAIERAVHTTPPITMAATIPLVPLSPTPTKITEAIIKVIKVMPDTGLEPTMAMALAATVVNKKAIMATTKKAISAWKKLLITPK